MKVAVVIHERHNMIKEQTNLLTLRFFSYEVIKIEDCKWDKSYYDSLRERLEHYDAVVFVSPCPILLGAMAYRSGYYKDIEGYTYPSIWILHADDKVEWKMNDVVKYIAHKDSYRLISVNS